MKSNVLLRNLLLSSSSLNIWRHETDKKKKGKMVGQAIGLGLLYVLLMGFLVLMAVGYGLLGIEKHIPVLGGIAVIAIEFIFTFLKTNGYLFAFRDYDMLMSLPFSTKQIVSSKFLYMYVKNLPWVVIITLAMEIGYGIFAKPAFIVYIVWFVLAMLLPLIPMVVASVLGALIAGISSGFKYKKMIQTFLTIIFVLFCFSLRFIIEAIFKNGNVEATLENIAEVLDGVTSWYFPLAWFEGAVCNLNLVDLLLYVLVSVAVFEVAFTSISVFYKGINGRLMTGGAHTKTDMKKSKQRSVAQTIAFKEWKRFLNSTNYFVNNGLGMILTVIFCIAVLFLDMDKVIAAITQGAPVTKEMLLPAVPMIVFFFVGMTSTCTVSPSLEGNQMWLIESLPLTKKAFYNGKMLFNLYTTVPFAVLGNVVIGIACGGTFVQLLLFALCGIIQSLYNTTWGLVCGIRHIKLEWENEMEVIKQGSAVAIYMLPNMFITMGLCVLSVVLGLRAGTEAATLACCALYAVPALLCWLWVRKEYQHRK